jgi:hypothetical protein
MSESQTYVECKFHGKVCLEHRQFGCWGGRMMTGGVVKNIIPAHCFGVKRMGANPPPGFQPYGDYCLKCIERITLEEENRTWVENSLNKD